MSGQVVPLDASEVQVDPTNTETVQITGEVRWKGNSLKGGVIQAFRGAALLKEGYQTRVSEDGKIQS